MVVNIKGDLLSVESGIIVHGCNAQGVMGSGVALAVKNKYPKAYEDYKYACEEHNHGKYNQPSQIVGQVNYVKVTDELVIANAITQVNYGWAAKKYVSYDAIYDAFKNINNTFRKYNIPKILSFPSIGCGLGGGSWSIVESIINECLDNNIEKRHYTL